MRWTATVIVILVLSVVDAAGQAAPDGELVYRENCASCHEGEVPRVLSQVDVRDASADYIYAALRSGLMKRQGAELDDAEKRAVAEFLSGNPVSPPPIESIPQAAHCQSVAPPVADPLTVPGWNGWGVDLRNSRFQTAEAAGLTADDVPRLRLKWAFGMPAVAVSGSQATIVGGRLLVGSQSGLVFSLDAGTGCIHWIHEADNGVRSALSVGPARDGGHAAYFGDGEAQVSAIDFETGALLWKARVETHSDAWITGAPALHEGRLYVPVASIEEVSAVAPSYECCTFRGSVVALDAATGDELWKTYVISDEPQRTDRNAVGAQRWAPSGAGIWSAPTLDPEHDLLYVATGDSYSDPAAPESDAVMALSMETGEVRWVSQTTPGDAFTVACMAEDPVSRANCPDSEGPDVDYGSSPVLLTKADGERLLLAGQKSGVMYGMSPETGVVQWESRIADGGILGGIEWGFATDGEVTYAAISEALEKAPGDAGGVTALRVADGTVVWHAPPVQDTCGSRQGCHTAQPGAVTMIPGVVFVGSLDGHFRAHAADSGRVIWDVDTVGDYDTINGVPARGGALNGGGATVANGMVYVNSGYATFGFMPGNVLLAFSVEGQ